MSATKTAEPEPTSALSEGRDFVGVALLTPLPSAYSSISAMLFYDKLETGLRAKGIEPTDNGAVFGPGFIV